MQTSIEVKRIDLWTLFRLAFFIYAAIGLIVGLFYAFIIAVAGTFGESFALEAGEGLPGIGLLTGVLGLVMVPVMSFVYGAMGAVVVTIGGAIFNLVSRMSGGLRFEVGLVTPSMTPAAATPPPPPPRPTEPVHPPEPPPVHPEPPPVRPVPPEPPPGRSPEPPPGSMPPRRGDQS